MTRLVEGNFEAGQESIVQVTDRPDEPRVSVSPRRVAVASLGGFGGGALIGLIEEIWPGVKVSTAAYVSSLELS